MEYEDLYKCFGDFNRLRILNLLIEGPLCVCHIHEILGESQPKVSRLLHHLKAHGGVESERYMNWSMYRVPVNPHPVLSANLKCLLDLRNEDIRLQQDLDMRNRIVIRMAALKKGCPLQPNDLGSDSMIFCSSDGN